MTPPSNVPLAILDRYALFDPLARGGMATVHISRQVGAAGFSKIVAVKRMHEHLASNEHFVNMFVDEARLAGRLRHPNVVSVVDVVAHEGEAFLVMEYVHGQSLSQLIRSAAEALKPVPVSYAVQIARGALEGLHAAHNATNAQGEPLQLVHRDVSPQNILVGVDGIARVLDFGIAKAVGRLQDSSTGQVKGKVSYMAPEQVVGQPVDQRTDVYAIGVVLWECLAQRRLFKGENSAEVIYRVLNEPIPPLAAIDQDISRQLSDAVEKAVSKDPNDRFSSAQDFAQALEDCCPVLPAREIGNWVNKHGGTKLSTLQQRVVEIEALELDMTYHHTATTPVRAKQVSEPRTPPLVVAGENDETLATRPGDQTVANEPVTTSQHKAARGESSQKKRNVSIGVFVLGAAAAAAFWFTRPAPSEDAPSISEETELATSPAAESAPSDQLEASGQKTTPADSKGEAKDSPEASTPAPQTEEEQGGDGSAPSAAKAVIPQAKPVAPKPAPRRTPRPRPAPARPKAEDLFERE